MLTAETLIGLLVVCGFSTLLGSAPVLFHKYLKDAQWNWWESFGGGVMMGASLFSLFWPALKMIHEKNLSYLSFPAGILTGLFFIGLSAMLIRRLTSNLRHQKAFLFVFVMGLHNVPEGLSVGVDVAILGWAEAIPLSVSIFVQNLPEGFASSMKFLIAGFSVPQALLANGLTAVIEAGSSILGFQFIHMVEVSLPFTLTFAGASMMMVVILEIIDRRREEAASFARSGFVAGLILVAVLDLFL